MSHRFYRSGRSGGAGFLRGRMNGFTLIELLVVISIIGVLVAMLLPTLGASRKVARAAVCATNEKQQYLGFVAYATDFRDYIPANYVGTGNFNTILGSCGYFGAPQYAGPHATDWAWANYPRYSVFGCPDEKGVDFTGSGYGISTNFDNEFIRSSYTMNWSVSQYSYGVPRKGFSNPLGTTPAEGTFVCDGRAAGFGWDFVYFEWGIDGVFSSWEYGFRHPNNTMNMMFMDGHVQTNRKHISESGVANFVWLWAYGDMRGLQ
jgi:prepilin-type N-terminal cleavage/methylation domain-containing protein/prepilin-type processing-associated H-X9-DG protein